MRVLPYHTVTTESASSYHRHHYIYLISRELEFARKELNAVHETVSKTFAFLCTIHFSLSRKAWKCMICLDAINSKEQSLNTPVYFK